jgi:UDP-2,4-diacetamido-2,4,6-trideoxy-beta-L-altropyranose hydrolase
MSAPIRVAIRADAGAAIGTGHFSRAAAVADALSGCAIAKVVLVCNAEGAALVPRYFPPETTVLTLASDDDGPGVAMRTMRAAGWMPDVVCLDQYGAVPDWETLVAGSGIRLMVIDDLDAAKSSDVIVRPHGRPAEPNGSLVLRGPAYLPLSRHVTKAAAGGRSRRSAARPRLNVCFGGSDPTGETAKALRAATGLGGIDLDVVVGPAARLNPELIEAARAMPHVTLHRAPTQGTLAELMAAADLALGAGGVMQWERLCLGVPSLVVATADNQRAQVDTMVAAGAIRYLGEHSQVTPDAMAEAVAVLAADEAACKALSECGRKLVDGRGALRLAAWIRALALEVRDVRAGDARDLLNWRLDDRNWQYNWDSAAKPDYAAHDKWLAAKLSDPACVFRIVSLGPDPVGVVRFDLGDGGTSAYLSIYLVPEWHGRGMGLAVYCAAERALRRSHPAVTRIVSRIHGANAASERMHRDAGFQVVTSRERADWLDASKALD